ncbi:unnamed protein product, partial [Iphiclides podalirius]
MCRDVAHWASAVRVSISIYSNGKSGTIIGRRSGARRHRHPGPYRLSVTAAPPARGRTARRPKETGAFLRALAAEREKGRSPRVGVGAQWRRRWSGGGPMGARRRGGRAHLAAPSPRRRFLFIVARNAARDGRVMCA